MKEKDSKNRRNFLEKLKPMDNENENVLLSQRSAKSATDRSDDEKQIESSKSDQKLISKSNSNVRSKAKSNSKSKQQMEMSNKEEINGSINQAFQTETIGDKISNKPPRRARKTKQKTEIEQVEKQDPNILAIIIHRTDKLRTDVNIYNPTLRIHILDLDTDGQYVKKSKKDRNTLIYYEKENRKLDYISPISTTPYDFKINKTNVPRWEELIVINEEFSHFTKEHPQVLIMFELIDFRKRNDLSSNFQTYTSQETNQDWQRIAWAFLKIRSFSNLNVEKKLRLQLFYSQTKYKFNSIESMVPEIYNLYKNGPRVKYPASLHVTIKSIIQPNNFIPGVGSSDYLFAQNLNAADQNFPNLNANDSKIIDTTDSEEKKQFESSYLKTNKHNQVIWSRIAGLPCRVPNEFYLKLDTSKKGCYTVKFSNTGNFLACACIENDSDYPVLVYNISGELIAKFNGHFGLIYEISWSKSDNYVVTASNDATARIFDNELKSKEAFKILPHPSFVYTAKFVPNSLDKIVTGGYDKVIRIWSIGNQKKKYQKYGELLQELYGHNGYINSTCFTNDTKTFFSADSLGVIKMWKTNSDSNTTGWTIIEDILVPEIKNDVINFIQLLPNQFRMLVQLKNNQLNVIDVRIKSVVQKFDGIFNQNQNFRSCISPCGTFLFNSGSDTNIYCWNLNTGDQLDTITLNFVKPTRDMDFHPYDNYIVFCCNDSNAPVLVYKHNAEKIFKNYESKPFKEEIGFLKPHRPEKFDESEFDKKLKTDIKKIKDAQDSIWTMVNDKLDSVYPRGLKNKNELWSKNNYAGSLTMTMKDRENRPEFKYRGPKEVEDRVVSLYNYRAQRGDELDLKIGDELLVLVRENENWWLGELVETKQEGYFPAAYVQEKSTIETPKINRLQKHNVNGVPIIRIDNENSDLNKIIEPIPFVKMPSPSNYGLISDIKKSENVKHENKIKINNSRPMEVHSVLNSNLKIEQQVNIINEIPTKDKTNSTRNNHKRRTFAHIITGSQSNARQN